MPTLVVLRALKLGDLVAATPALRALARAFPLHRRVLCMPAGLRPVARLVGGIDEIADTRELAPINPRLARPAVAVNLHGRGPQSTRILHALEPHELIAFADRPGAGPVWDDDEHERARWCRLLAAAGIPADAADLRLRVPPPGPWSHLAGATVVHPGASSAARRWPTERFAAVAHSERAGGKRVVVTGDRSEAALTAAVVDLAGLPAHADLGGRTDLAGLSEIVAHAGAVVSGDTGIAHLATGFATPSVVLFGPMSPARWGPPPGTARHHAIWKGEAGDPHGATPSAGLLRVDVDEVVEALRALPRAC